MGLATHLLRASSPRQEIAGSLPTAPPPKPHSTRPRSHACNVNPSPTNQPPTLPCRCTAGRHLHAAQPPVAWRARPHPTHAAGGPPQAHHHPGDQVGEPPFPSIMLLFCQLVPEDPSPCRVLLQIASLLDLRALSGRGYLLALHVLVILSPPPPPSGPPAPAGSTPGSRCTCRATWR